MVVVVVVMVCVCVCVCGEGERDTGDLFIFRPLIPMNECG